MSEANVVKVERPLDEMHILRMHVALERIARIEAELRAAKIDRQLLEANITRAVCKDGEHIVELNLEKKLVIIETAAPAET